MDPLFAQFLDLSGYSPEPSPAADEVIDKETAELADTPHQTFDGPSAPQEHIETNEQRIIASSSAIPVNLPCPFKLCTFKRTNTTDIDNHVQMEHGWYISRQMNQLRMTPMPRSRPSGNMSQPNEDRPVHIPDWANGWNEKWLEKFHDLFDEFPAASTAAADLNTTTDWSLIAFDMVQECKDEARAKGIPQTSEVGYISKTFIMFARYGNTFWAAKFAQEIVNLQFVWFNSIYFSTMLSGEQSRKAALFVTRVAKAEVEGLWSGLPRGIARRVYEQEKKLTLGSGIGGSVYSSSAFQP